jgi:hypothetical protein
MGDLWDRPQAILCSNQGIGIQCYAFQLGKTFLSKGPQEGPPTLGQGEGRILGSVIRQVM